MRFGAVRPAVRAEMVKPILDKYPKAVKDEAEKLYAELAEARKGETQRLEKLLRQVALDRDALHQPGTIPDHGKNNLARFSKVVEPALNFYLLAFMRASLIDRYFLNHFRSDPICPRRAWRRRQDVHARARL